MTTIAKRKSPCRNVRAFFIEWQIALQKPPRFPKPWRFKITTVAKRKSPCRNVRAFFIEWQIALKNLRRFNQRNDSTTKTSKVLKTLEV